MNLSISIFSLIFIFSHKFTNLYFFHKKYLNFSIFSYCDCVLITTMCPFYLLYYIQNFYKFGDKMNVSLDYNGNKSFRLLNIYERLQRGEYLSKSELAADYSVTEKTIQRDINDIRAYLIETHIYDNTITIKYDKFLNKYYMFSSGQNYISNDEALTICKILIENCSLPKEKLNEIISKILNILPIHDRTIINNAIASDMENYSPLQNDYDITLRVWDLTKYSQNNSLLFLSYFFPNQNKHNYLVYPVAVVYHMNSFFLIAYTKENHDFTTVFNFNEIIVVKPISRRTISDSDDDHPKSSQYSLEENSPFEIKNVIFKYKGNFPSIILKFPTAELLYEHNGIRTIRIFYSEASTIDWLKSNNNVIDITFP